MITLDELKRLVAPLSRRVSTMVSRVVLRNVDDAHDRQETQLEGFRDELHPVVENFQPFGLRAIPPVGSEGIGIAVGGERNHLVVVGLAPKFKPDQVMEEGDVLVYCLDPKVYALAKKAGSYSTQGRVTWSADMADLPQYIVMTPKQTVLHVEDPDTGKKSRITITPTMVKIETDNFIHP
jgi:phage baseplate assembly protein V